MPVMLLRYNLKIYTFIFYIFLSLILSPLDNMVCSQNKKFTVTKSRKIETDTKVTHSPAFNGPSIQWTGPR